MADQNNPTVTNENVFCAHCGTENTRGIYACTRCGERLVEVDTSVASPLGLVSCAHCGGTNNTRAAYCWVCGKEMNDAVRISPDPQAAPASQPESMAQADAAPRAESHRMYRPDLNPASDPRRAGERNDEPADLRSPDPTHDANIGTNQASDNPAMGEELSDNTSGTKNAVVPEEIKGWNWAAFLMPQIWGLFSGVPLAVILFGAAFMDPLVQAAVLLAGGLYLGFKGNELAWRGKKWRSVAHFKAYQKQWRDGSIRLSIAVAVLFFVFALMQAGS